MKIRSFLILIFIFASFITAQDITATTSDGKEVILHSNGAWEYAPEKIFDIPVSGSFTIGPKDAKVTIIEWTDFQ